MDAIRHASFLIPLTVILIQKTTHSIFFSLFFCFGLLGSAQKLLIFL